MKNRPYSLRTGNAAFTLVEMMFSMTIAVLVLGLAMSTFLYGLRAMYKDGQRLATNASLRSFMAQVSKETLDASYFYLFPYYTALDGSVNLLTDYATLDPQNSPIDDYDKWVAHGDCLVLVTKTSLYRTTDIRQIRIYYRVTTNQTTRNSEAPLRYYETADWGESDPNDTTLSNGHTNLTTELNLIDLNANPLRAGTKLLNARTKGRAVPSPYTGYAMNDLYPLFSTDSSSDSPTNGFISINVEFINGANAGTNQLLSSSSFNYTISPRR